MPIRFLQTARHRKASRVNRRYNNHRTRNAQKRAVNNPPSSSFTYLYTSFMDVGTNITGNAAVFGAGTLPDDTQTGEVGNATNGVSDWGTGKFDAANVNGMVDNDYGFKVGHKGGTPSTNTGPNKGGMDGASTVQLTSPGYAVTEGTGGYSISPGKVHALRTPVISLNSSLSNKMSFFFLPFQRNTIVTNWTIKVQYSPFGRFTSGIVDLDVTWGKGDANQLTSSSFNGKAFSNGGDNKFIDSSSSFYSDPWFECEVDLNNNNGADFTQPFYLRFYTLLRAYTQDLGIDTVKIYGE